MKMMEFGSEMQDPFIRLPRVIEEIGLKPLTHRVYTRIAYRAFGVASQGHFETQENMAKAIFISVRQIRRELEILEKRQMIRITNRGKNKWGHFIPNLITVLDISAWIRVSNDVTDSHMDKSHHRTHSPAAGGLTVRPRADSQADITRSQNELDLKLTINAVEQKPAAVKKEKKATWKPTSKMKTWDEKSEIEKMDCVLHKAIDAHRAVVERGRAKPYLFESFPDVLAPLIQEHGIEKAKEFFDAIKEGGCDVRKLSKAMKQFACPANKISAEPILVPEPIESFPQEIIKQVETNKMYIATSPIKIDEVKVESFPVRLRKFYDSLKSKRERIELKKEVALMGIENFLKMRATAIIRCTYEELFT